MEPPYIRTGSTEEAEAYRRQSGEWTGQLATVDRLD